MPCKQMAAEDLYGHAAAYRFVGMWTVAFPLSALLNPPVGYVLDRCGYPNGAVITCCLGLLSSLCLAVNLWVAGAILVIVW